MLKNNTSSIAPYCISAFVICITDQVPRYLLIRRCGHYLPGTWQMVTGGIDEGETASQAALREIEEETGLIPSRFYCADAVETFYIQARDHITFAPVFVAFVTEMTVRLSPEEHDAYEWLPMNEAIDRLAWSEQKRVISHVHEQFVLKKPNDLLLVNPPALKQTISRTGVYGMAIRNNQLLLVKQHKGPHAGKFDLPGGGIESGESVEEALRREFKEEVGMTFESMQLLDNRSATTKYTNENGETVHFHQIGLIYQIKGLSSPQQEGELSYFWIDLKELSKQPISPFVEQLYTNYLLRLQNQ